MSRPAGTGSLSLAYSDPRGRGRPVLLVHGFSHNRAVWERFAEELPSEFRPISIDLRGHGESPWAPDAAYDLVDYARDLPVLLDALEIESVVVVGHSLGGNVSTLFAAAEPKRVDRLILVDTGPVLELGGMTHVVEDVEELLRSYATVDEFQDQLAMIHPNGDAEILARLAAAGLAERIDGRFEPAFDPGVLGMNAGSSPATEIAVLERELWIALRELSCPVLVVRGGLSAILSEKVAREMVDEVLVDGRLITLPTAGHAVMIDDATGLLAAVEGFLAAE